MQETRKKKSFVNDKKSISIRENKECILVLFSSAHSQRKPSLQCTEVKCYCPDVRDPFPLHG